MFQKENKKKDGKIQQKIDKKTKNNEEKVIEKENKKGNKICIT